MILAFSQR